MKKVLIIIAISSVILAVGVFFTVKLTCNNREKGDVIDRFNGVAVYYNGDVKNISGRNYGRDGYNLGLKYQCVEFVKRYYYEHLNHKMPNSYGNAKDFFNRSIKDGGFNKSRGLQQFTNSSMTKPRVSDLLIYKGHLFNKFGHVSIVSKVTNNLIEIIQQNPGAGSPSRERYKLSFKNGRWKIKHDRVMGWLRK